MRPPTPSVAAPGLVPGGSALLLALALASAPSHAQSSAEAPPPSTDEAEVPDEEVPDEEVPDEEVTIVARRREMRRVAGSAHTVDKESLERFEPDDVQRALRGVPGVYVRDEDGQGLRPNIGLRGASSDRSAKVVLLEDGVLFAPAPYSAPAAYYFPMATRMVGVEVFKGPAAIRQGPHTVGGALNLRTRAIPLEPMAFLDAGVGLAAPDAPNAFDRTQHRVHGGAGVGSETWGFFLEGARVQSDGFKRIDGARDAPAGFVRDDVMLKARVGNSIFDEVSGTLELKLGVQREESDETYLGLSDADFRADPHRRYAASASDHMSWGRTQAQLRYVLSVMDQIDVDVVAYRHDLDRSWNKVNGVRGAPNLHDVLTFADAGAFPVFVSQLRGDADAGGADVVAGADGAILIGPNQRRFFSQGIATRATASFSLGDAPWIVDQRVEVGLRLHNDGVHRVHSQRGFTLVDRQLVDLGEADEITADNDASALAFAAHIGDEIRVSDFVIVPGARVELVRGTFRDRASGGVVESDQVAVLPGVGAAWQPIKPLVVIAGVHRGFSPIAPGQSADVRPEESTNVEAGARLDLARMVGFTGELIGFYSHYENILGECTYSSGCIDDIGAQTNGGTASIAGVEALARHDLPLRFGLLGDEAKLRSEASYTFTRAVFLTSFDSAHPLFSRVSAGDEMAYVPAHRAAFTGAIAAAGFDVGVSVGLESAMRDVPGQGEAPASELTDPQAIIDGAASFTLAPGVRVGLRADNVLDQRAIVSRRPFGARPGKPRSFLVSIELETP